MTLAFYALFEDDAGAITRERLTVMPDPLGSLDDLRIGARVSHDLRFEDGTIGRYWRVRERDGDRVGLEFVA